ncbi:hypothetical protein KNJ79_02755 [Sphingopyxis indica]|uniref:hypothetical protein n=1 Tax=Sphingopyxis indica TaxID=436663 RepID=UPI002938D213|nr:hypothetical protein [Sphingopyxis indica]WOF43892.1 hypothetical protein KNJ79_02755 [Sphingopyxis indica]
MIRGWHLLSAASILVATGFGAIQALGTPDANGPNTKITIDTGTGETFIAYYRCPRIHDQKNGLKSAAVPNFRTIIFNGEKSSFVISTADIPNAFCGSGRYLGPSEISGPFNLAEFRLDPTSGQALFVRKGAVAGAQVSSPIRLEISSGVSKPTPHVQDNRQNVIFFKNDMEVQYASLPVAELSITARGNALTPESYAAMVNEIRSRIAGVSATRSLSGNSMCVFPQSSIDHVLLTVHESDVRRRLLNPFIRCSKGRRGITGENNKIRIELTFSRARSAKLSSSKIFQYDISKPSGDGYLLSCNLPIDLCDRNVDLSSLPAVKKLFIQDSHYLEEIDLGIMDPIAIYHSDKDIGDSIIFVDKDLQAFDIGGVL